MWQLFSADWYISNMLTSFIKKKAKLVGSLTQKAAPCTYRHSHYDIVSVRLEKLCMSLAACFLVLSSGRHFMFPRDPAGILLPASVPGYQADLLKPSSPPHSYFMLLLIFSHQSTL